MGPRGDVQPEPIAVPDTRDEHRDHLDAKGVNQVRRVMGDVYPRLVARSTPPINDDTSTDVIKQCYEKASRQLNEEYNIDVALFVTSELYNWPLYWII